MKEDRKIVDEHYMKEVLNLAKQGMGRVEPNPMVGCIVVKNGEVISMDYHREYGKNHAERNALSKDLDFNGATLYVNLEPCCHYGKTPPCTDIIIEKGIKRVVIGSTDINQKVNGRGIEILRKAGIEVETGVLKEECDDFNRIFFYHIKNRKPFVLLKYAMSLDGKISLCNGISKWVSSATSRAENQRDRKEFQAILVGVNTVLKDDPMLTCRDYESEIIRIVLDSKLRIPLHSRIVESSKEHRTIIATISEDKEKIKVLRDRGIEIIRTSEDEGKVDIKNLMEVLYERNIVSVIIEGGGETAFSALKTGVVNRVKCYIAPKIFGGIKSITPVSGRGFQSMDEIVKIKNMTVRESGEDLAIEGDI